jgi:protein TonB
MLYVVPARFVSARFVGFCGILLLHLGLIYLMLANSLIDLPKLFKPTNTTLTIELPRQSTLPPPPEPVVDGALPLPVPKAPAIRISPGPITVPGSSMDAVATADPASAIEVTAPVELRISKPTYPARARRLGFEGTIILLLLIGEDGRVKEGRIDKSSGHALLDDTALQHALRYWRFKPARREGQAVSVWHPMDVTFRLID